MLIRIYGFSMHQPNTQKFRIIQKTIYAQLPGHLNDQ